MYQYRPEQISYSRFMRLLRRVTIPIFLIIMSSLVCMTFLYAAAEVYFRLRYPSSTTKDPKIQSDDLLGWDSVPPVEKIDSGTGAGLDVYFLGDSFIQGKNWPKEARAEAEKKGVRFQGYNLGVSGFGTYQEYLKFKREFDSHRPKLVVLLFFAWNDLRDDYPFPGVYYSPSRQSPPYLIVERGQVQKIPSKPSFFTPLLVNSEVYARVISRLLRKSEGSLLARSPDFFTNAGIRGQVYYDDIAAWAPFYRPDMENSAYVRGAYASTREAFKELKDFIKKNDSRLLVIGIDNAFTVDEDVADKYLKPISGADADLPLTNFGKMMADEGIDFINAQPELLALHKKTGKKVYNGPGANIGGHLEPEGDRLIVELAAGWIIKQIGR